MRVGEALLDLLFPPKCPFCQRLLHDPRAPLCPNCQASLPWLTGRAGERRVDFTQGCWSPLAYQAQVREAVQRYKFAPAPAYGRPFGLLMAQCARDQGVEAELVTWAPLSKKRRRKRGFDQGNCWPGPWGNAWRSLCSLCWKRAGIQSLSPVCPMERPVGLTPWGPILCCREGE